MHPGLCDALLLVGGLAAALDGAAGWVCGAAAGNGWSWSELRSAEAGGVQQQLEHTCRQKSVSFEGRG
jgi:hypothetical protein